MFNSPISKTQQELVQAARAATSDYITNGTDLTEAVVKAASAITPLTSEHVRRICEMTYHDAYERLFAEKTGSHQYVSFDPPDAIRASELLDALQLGVNQQHNFNKLASTGGLMDKTASSYSMPRKFQRMNTHELWTKAASGTEIPDSNPTRELQQVHRDLKDSISTVKSELYAAEHNEKLAMIDMVKQAKAGLSAGHSMEQVLHAALSVVDASEPFMAKTAHDLCATIIEACADHQNSGFRKEAEFILMSPREGIERARENSKGWEKNPMKLIYNFDHDKKASTPQEVNPNHPIPQKFKKLAEANIQRKHLEVTLDELNRNMDYFNEKLKDELTR